MSDPDGNLQPARRGDRVRKSASAFRTISEVSDELDVPQHVLRFWETKFSQIRPMKRGGGRRYYRPEDITLLRGIRELLYADGYTIKGVQKLLRQHGVRLLSARARGDMASPLPSAGTAVGITPPEPSVPHAESATEPANMSGGGSKSAAQPAASASLDKVQRDALRAVLIELEEMRALLKAAS